MLIKDIYKILETESYKINNFLNKVEFCFVNEKINAMIEYNNEMFEKGKGQIVERIFEESLVGEIFFVFEKEDKIYLIMCENEKELKDNIYNMEFNDEVRKKGVIKYGQFKGIEDKKNKKKPDIKEAANNIC